MRQRVGRQSAVRIGSTARLAAVAQKRSCVVSAITTKSVASNGDECCLTAASLAPFLGKTRGSYRPSPESTGSTQIWRKFRVSARYETFGSDTCIHPHLASLCEEVHLPARKAYLRLVALPKT